MWRSMASNYSNDLTTGERGKLWEKKKRLNVRRDLNGMGKKNVESTEQRWEG